MRSFVRVCSWLSLGLMLVATAACGGGDGGLPNVIGLPPTISSISPNSGPTSGNTQVTINGTNFTSLITVSIGGNLGLNVNVINSTTLTCFTPPGSAGAVNVQVSTATGSDTLNAGFNYVPVLTRSPGSFPVVNITALNDLDQPASVLIDILNMENTPSVFCSDVPFSGLSPIANGDVTPEMLESNGYHFGLEPATGVVFWYDDLADMAAGAYPDGWCLDVYSEGAVRIVIGTP